MLFFNFVSGGKLLDNVALVSVARQCESVIMIYISPPSGAAPASPHPTPRAVCSLLKKLPISQQGHSTDPETATFPILTF